MGRIEASRFRSRALAPGTLPDPWSADSPLELTITLPETTRRDALFGAEDTHLRLIRDLLGVRISARNSTIKLSGTPQSVGRAATVLERLQKRIQKTKSLCEEDVVAAIADASKKETQGQSSDLEVYASSASIVPKTEGQTAYIQAVSDNDLVFCLGPAGTGKTYLAVAMAVTALKRSQIKRIVLVRPAVEAGEKLGYLPGDLQAKVNPYLRPLFDAMHDMMTFDQIKRFMVNDVIEVIPLAFMRGRTLNNSAILLDEAQNTTVPQMLMFLTRLGHNSKMIVTGDDSQIDLAAGQESGLLDAARRLRNVSGVGVIRLLDVDIVRHRLVQHIVSAYADNGPGGRDS